MSALPPKADIAACDRHVRFVPKADIGRKARPFDLQHVMMLRQSFDYRKWIGLDIGVVTHHVGRVGPHCSRPAYPRHIAQALQPRFERRTFGDMSNLHKPFVWSRHWNPGFRQPPGELSHAAKRCLAPKETRYALYQRRLLPDPGS